jgi:quinol monooxygenase YgiN
VTIHAHDDKQSELLSACQLITDQTRQETGCKDCKVSQDFNNENIITLDQRWEQWPSLNNYFRSDHFTALLGAMKWLGRSYEIRINEGIPEEGMVAVKRARSAGQNNKKIKGGTK